jgi:hypothetical protein
MCGCKIKTSVEPHRIVVLDGLRKITCGACEEAFTARPEKTEGGRWRAHCPNCQLTNVWRLPERPLIVTDETVWEKP